MNILKSVCFNKVRFKFKVDALVLFAQITVIDCDLEIGHDLYSSFLQGIYKGLTLCFNLLLPFGSASLFLTATTEPSLGVQYLRAQTNSRAE